MTGVLRGIGIGPGDPELITVKALRYLQTAPVVAFPAGRNGQMGVAERAIATWLKPHQQRLPLYFPYVQDPKTLNEAWDVAAAAVWPHLEQGDVVFASEGDISFYSTFSYLARSLQRQYPNSQIEAVPGICSPLAAAAATGQPLTLQSQKLTVVPALYALEQLPQLLNWVDVLVLLKVSSVYPQVWQLLQQHQLLERSYVVEHATTADQIVYADLSRHPNLQLPYFSLLITQVHPCVLE